MARLLEPRRGLRARHGRNGSVEEPGRFITVLVEPTSLSSMPTEGKTEGMQTL